MKNNPHLAAFFFLLVSAAAVAQGRSSTPSLTSDEHHKSLNGHISLTDTAEIPDERRDDPWHKKHPITFNPDN